MYNKLAFAIIFLSIQFTTFSQGKQKTLSHLFNSAEKMEVPQVEIDTSNSIWLEMAFGDWAIENLGEINEILAYANKFNRVDLVYSDFPKNMNFNSLNKKRLESLRKQLPNLFSDSTIEFRLIKQTNCATQAEAQKLPHGIQLHIMKSNQIEVVEDEKGIDYEEKIIETTTVAVSKQNERIESSLIIPNGAMGTDSTVLKVFERNVDLLKDSVVIITDLTYSMAPFTWQILNWQKEIRQSKKVLAHIFFNDGDKTPDKEKMLGKAGGIYITETTDLDSVSRLMAQVQENGNGGDIPENDLEVLLFAIENYPNAKEYILIADAKSSIRDFELLSKIDKPIRVFLARTDRSYGSINGQYLDLAYQTDGSLFTEHYDFPDKGSLETPKEYLKQLQEAYKKANGKN